MKISRALIGVGLSFAASYASATIDYTFYANGVTENYAQQGVAVFSFADDGSTLSITLTNTVNPTAAIQSEITGLDFGLSFAPTTMTLLSVSAAQIIDCSNVSSPCPPGAGSMPYGWGITTNGGSVMLGAGFDGSGFAFQPYGIVSSNYLAVAGAGELSTPSNNPLFIGPVTFDFSLAGLQFAPEVGAVAFAFGDPDIQPAQEAVPEPSALALLAVGLISLGWISRRPTRKPPPNTTP